MAQSSASIEFRKMDHEDRLRWLGEKVVDTADVQRVITLCKRLWRQAGAKAEGNCMFVTGDTGAGKSTAVAAFADEMFAELKAKRPESAWDRPRVVNSRIRPIWEVVPGKGHQCRLGVVVVNAKPTFKSLLRGTARALGIKLPSRFDFEEAEEKINVQIEKQGVKMLVFDEVQHIKQAAIDKYSAADVIKMMVKSRLQVVCVGLPDALDLLLIAAKDSKGFQGNDQLRRLVQKKAQVRPLPCSLDDFPPPGHVASSASIHIADTPFRRFCLALDNRKISEAIILPFDESSKISDPQTAIRLWRAFRGYVGKMMEFLFAATDLAIEKRMSRLNLKVMAAAYREMVECPDKDNWFMMDIADVHRRFHEKDEDEKKSDQEGTGEKKGGRRDNPLQHKH
jgi:hypothetical protein